MKSKRKQASQSGPKRSPRPRIPGTVGVRELRANLPRFLKWVSAGNTLTVMNGATEVGRLVPPLVQTVDAWAELERSGLLSAREANEVILPPLIPLSEENSISSAVEEDREERF